MSGIEYFYSAHSAYAYIGSARLMQIAASAKCPIVHRPYDLRRAIAAFGGAMGNRSEMHKRYFFGREITRWAEHRDIHIMQGRPTHHDNDIALPNSVLIAAIQQGRNVDALAHAMLEAHWRDDADLADRKTLDGLIRVVGFEPDSLLVAAQSDEINGIYAVNTEEAIARSVFGSPTYFVDGDMFYGQDRLELVERALVRPYK